MTSRHKPTNTPLSEHDVRSMRLRHSLGKATPRELAAERGLAVETVRKILRWETWAWVSEEGPGATHEQWAGGKPALTDEAIAASKARFLAGESGLARLQEEAAVVRRTDNLINELTDGGKDGNGV